MAVVKVTQAYRFALEPTPAQERALRSHAGAARLVLDRDENAARNLRDLAASGAERLNACGGAVRPGHAGRAPVKQEPGTAPADETGTADRQREAAA
jgi:hypothetical protein